MDSIGLGSALEYSAYIILFAILVISLLFTIRRKMFFASIFILSSILNIFFLMKLMGNYYKYPNFLYLIVHNYWPWINLVLFLWLVFNYFRRKRWGFLRLSKKKVLLSLIPFIPILLTPIIYIEFPLKIPFAETILSLQFLLGVLSYGLTLFMALPLKPLLTSFGMWEHHSSLFIAFSGPEISILGIVLTASIYSIIIYLSMSLFRNKP